MPRHASSPLDRIEIASPCSAEWDSMTGNDRVRFCEHCRLHVQDVSAMTPAEAFNLVRRSSGRLCLRIHRRPDGSLVTRTPPAPLYQLRRRVSRVAAGAFGAALGLSAAVSAQAQPPAARAAAEASAYAETGGQAGGQEAGGVTLSGIVLRTDGEPLPAAFVTVDNEKTGLRLGAISDAAGSYKIEGLPVGTYTIWISKPGFGALKTQGVVLAAGAEARADIVAEESQEAPTVESQEARTVQSVTTGIVIVAVEPSEPLVKAAYAEDLAAVRRLLAGGADANVVDRATGTSALAQAVAKGNREIVVALLRAGAEVNARLEYRQTALMRLTPKTSEDVVRELLLAGAKVGPRDEDGNTALTFAAGWGAPGVVELLLRAGAAVNTRNKTRETPLMYAAREGLKENVRALISAGADLDLRDDSGATALKQARDREQAETADLLVAYGAADEQPEKKPGETAAQP